RELHGDVDGSLEAWSHALAGTQRGGVDHAWCSVQAGDLALRRGDPATARAAYDESLRALPGYWLARVGLARCALAGGELVPAEELLRPLVESHGDVATLALLSDVEELLGRDAEPPRARPL